MTVPSAQAVARIKEAGLIAILRGDFPQEQLLRIGETLRDAGIQVMEVTLNSTGALKGIHALRDHFGNDLLVGAGTVRTEENAMRALDAGASFFVSPNFDPTSFRYSLKFDVLHLPGVLTPTEAETAHRAGAKLLKLFPADAFGPSYLKALQAPMNDLQFVPTGGIDKDNLAAYVHAGAVAFGIGSALIRDPGEDLKVLEGRAQALVRAFAEARDA